MVTQETQKEHQALLGQLNLAISLLRQEQIELVRLHIFEGKSLAQIARDWGVNKEVVKQRWKRIVWHLKKILKNISKK